MKIEFVSYNGHYPNLCSGTLVLKLNGVETTFSSYGDADFKEFWCSGGCCGFTNDYNDSYIKKGKWKIDFNNIEEKLKPYADDLIKVFNENVPYGCCGGCL